MTTRLQNRNYSSDGGYYVTICTKGRDNIFGKIEQGKMLLNENGRITEQCWFDLPNHYPNLILDAFVIMPNHVHCIMIIDNSNEPVLPGNVNGHVSVDGDNIVVETGLKPVSTKQQQQQQQHHHQSSKPPHGIFEFVRAFKTFSSRRINELDNTPGKSRWQSRYWDHIIRNEQELFRIRQYIYDNPATWEKDSLK
jgi:putative transposase